jgi:hypothetical protein
MKNRFSSDCSRTLLCATLVFIVPFALFSPSLAFDFVYDARYQILSGDFLHTPSNWRNILTLDVMSMDVLDFNRPAHLASLMLDAALWGRNPFGYHLTNVILHASNSVLVFLVVLRILPSKTTAEYCFAHEEKYLPLACCAMAGALFFAVHPLQVEAVCEPSYREDLLVVFFTLATLLSASLARVWPIRTLRFLSGVACVVFCFLACAAKETGFMAVGILYLWRVCIDKEVSWSWWIPTLSGCFLATGIFVAMRFGLETADSEVFESKPGFLGGSFPAAVSIQTRILVLYARNLVNPAGLCADYGPPSLGAISDLEAAAALSVFVLVSLLIACRSNRAAFCLGFIVLGLLPVSNLLPMFRPAADRYIYLPMAGVGMLTAVLMSAIPVRGWVPGFFRISFAAIIVWFGLLSWNRQMVWRDSESLWEDTAKKNPSSRNAWLGLGFDLQRSGGAADSVVFFEKALEVSDSGDAEAWMGLAVALDARGDSFGAQQALVRALDANPDFQNPDSRRLRGIMERDHAIDTLKLLKKYQYP